MGKIRSFKHRIESKQFCLNSFVRPDVHEMYFSTLIFMQDIIFAVKSNYIEEILSYSN